MSLPSVDNHGTFICPEGCNKQKTWQFPKQYYEISIGGKLGKFRFAPVQGRPTWTFGSGSEIGSSYTTADVNEDIKNNYLLGKKIQLWHKTDGPIDGAFPTPRSKSSIRKHGMSLVVKDLEEEEKKATQGLKKGGFFSKKSDDDITRPGKELWSMWIKKTPEQQEALIKKWIQKIDKLDPTKQKLVTRMKTHMNSNDYGGKWVGDKWVKQPAHKKKGSVVKNQKRASQTVNYEDEEKSLLPLVGPNVRTRGRTGAVIGEQAHEEYENDYLFDNLDGIQMIDNQRDDASYGGFGTDRDFIDWNPNVNDYDRPKVFGYDGRTTSSIDYMLLSVTFVVFMAICCCLVVAVSFVSGYITKWWFSKKKKTQSDYDSISVSNV